MSPPGSPTLEFYDEKGKLLHPAAIEVGIGYQRKKGLKVLTRSVANPKKITRDRNRALVEFKSIIAVDTNTRDFSGVAVSVAAVTMMRNVEIGEHTWKAESVLQPALEFHNATIAPERIGWWCAIKMAADSNVEKPCAVVVDSELDALTDINARRCGFVLDTLLPEGFTLVYGSGERGTLEFIANRALAECDKHSAEILDRLASVALAQTAPSILNPSWCSHDRIWLPTRNEAQSSDRKLMK